jgi:hypothetical protein
MKFDLTIKTETILVAVFGGLITLLGFHMESNRHNMDKKIEENRIAINEQNKKAMAIKDFSMKQKELDLNLGIKMFETLMTQYLEKTSSQGSLERTHQQMLLLQLISLNFQDTPVNLRPLFEKLNSQLPDSNEKNQLHQIAIEVARRQAFRLTFNFINAWDSGEQPVKAGQDFVLKEGEVPFKIHIKEIKNDEINVALVPLSQDSKRRPLEFSVNYFAMPIVDNTKLDVYRVSVLRASNDPDDPKIARIRIIVFDSYLAPDRFDIKEMTSPMTITNDMGTEDLTKKK